jgi:hypothetical protein
VIVLVRYLSDALLPFFHLPGLQEATAQRYDRLFESGQDAEIGQTDASEVLADSNDLANRPYRIRTCDTLILPMSVHWHLWTTAHMDHPISP